MKLRMIFCGGMLFACMLLSLLISSSRCFAEQEGSETIAVCGEAPLADGRDAAVRLALADGKRRAAVTAVGRLLSPEAAVSGIFDNIINNYADYCTADEAVQQRERNGRLELFCRVTVDFAKVSAAIKKNIKALQLQQNGQQLFMFVRTVGLADSSEQHRQQVKLLRIYNQTMQNSGFDVGGGDYVTDFAMQHEQLSYEGYSAAAMNAVQERVEIGMAVIGEVAVSTLSEDAYGSTAAAKVTLQVIDCINNHQVGELTETYQLRRKTRAEAEQFVVNKAAHSSVRELETLLLNYWQNKTK